MAALAQPQPEAATAAEAEAQLEARWQHLQWLPCALSVEVSVPRMSVGDILRLETQTVVESGWEQNADVPLRANGQLIAWAEFEGVDDKLAVRVTRLA